MDEFNFDDLFARSRDALAAFRVLYQDLTGEELDVESGIRHYPLVAVALAAGAGATVGWFAARRLPRRLPPPAPEEMVEPPSTSAAKGPLEALEGFLPGTIESLRSIVPETMAEEATTAARNWLDQRLEPRLREGFETLDTRAGGFLRDALRRFEGGDDVHLDDSESS